LCKKSGILTFPMAELRLWSEAGKEFYLQICQSSFNASWLDGGASRTWYMALAAGMSSVLLEIRADSNEIVVGLGGAS